MKNNYTLALRASKMDDVKNALADISERYGHISPDILVQEAKDESHPCHEAIYGKDDEEAAYQYRLVIARLIIRSVKLDIVRLDAKKKEVSIDITRAYVSPPSIRGAESYVKLEVAMNDTEKKTELLELAKKELIAVKAKYKQLEELARVWEAIELL